MLLEVITMTIIHRSTLFNITPKKFTKLVLLIIYNDKIMPNYFF